MTGLGQTPRALPFPLPIQPMLAKAEEELPSGAGWVYEPKWDGFRAVMARTSDGVQLWSRQGKRLDAYFPELVALQGALTTDEAPATAIARLRVCCNVTLDMNSPTRAHEAGH